MTAMGRLQIAASDIEEIRDLNAAPAATVTHVTMVVAKARALTLRRPPSSGTGTAEGH